MQSAGKHSVTLSKGTLPAGMYFIRFKAGETDPLECPNCGAQMKIVGFIERDSPGLIKLLLSAAGLWREPELRPPPPEPAAEPEVPELVLDYEFFDMNCI